MNRWIEFAEPFNKDGDPVYCRVSPATAIKHVREKYADKPHIEISDNDALGEFMAVMWGYFVDVYPNGATAQEIDAAVLRLPRTNLDNGREVPVQVPE